VAFGRSIDVFATDARLITLTVLSGERDPVQAACKEKRKTRGMKIFDSSKPSLTSTEKLESCRLTLILHKAKL
jgi:hypothetical protein